MPPSDIKDKAGPPDFSEWQDFIGTVVLHWLCVAFVKVTFRGIDTDSVLSKEDREDIELDDDELLSIARPFAHLATHSSMNSKYGRAIMNSRDTIDATIVLFMYTARARRIARKYKGKHERNPDDNIARIVRPNANGTSPDSTGDSGEAPPAPHFAAAQYRPAFGQGFN